MIGDADRLDVVHVLADDGSSAAAAAIGRLHALASNVVVLAHSSDPVPRPEVAAILEEDPYVTRRLVPTLTIDRLLRTARDLGSACVTVPETLYRADRILLAGMEVMTRLATPAWPAVTLQVLRRPTRRSRLDNVLLVGNDGYSSGAISLVATTTALLTGANLEALVVGGRGREPLRPRVSASDADTARALRERHGLEVHYERIAPRIGSHALGRVVESLDAELVVMGLGSLPTDGVTYRDLSRDGRRLLLGGPLRLEHAILRSSRADVMLVIDSARLHRRSARRGPYGSSTGELFTGDLRRLEALIEREQAQAANQAAESGRS